MKKIICLFMVLNILCICTACGTEKSEIAQAKTNVADRSTYTGYPPIAERSFTPAQSDLPTVKIAHSFGIAQNEKPHEISVDSQSFFEKNNYKAVTFDTSSSKKVLYLTFDCGYENGYTTKILDVLKSKNVKAAFFCTLSNIKDEPELIARMIKDGHIVGNHSTTHPSFPEISRGRMADEILQCENYLRKNFGYVPHFFRFPMGEYNENALELVEEMGYTSVFWSVAYSDWNTENQRGKDYAVKTVTERLHPGAVILLHSVSADNASAMADIIDAARGKGYQFSTLDKIKFTHN